LTDRWTKYRSKKKLKQAKVHNVVTKAMLRLMPALRRDELSKVEPTMAVRYLCWKTGLRTDE